MEREREKKEDDREKQETKVEGNLEERKSE